MVVVHELRICHPYSVSTWERGLIYGNMKTAEQMHQTGGDGTMLLSSSPHVDPKYGEGSLNVNQVKLGDRLPSWATRVISADQLVLNDKTWVAFPSAHTIVTCPALTKLRIEARTLFLDDRGTTENALGLTKEQLAVRTVEHVDLGAVKVDPADYREDRDPAKYKSKLTGKGPLTPGWQERESQMMCTYKVIIAECTYFPVTSQLEQLLANLVRKLTILANRTVFTTLDEWYPLTIHQILEIRDEKVQARGGTIEYRPERHRLAIEYGLSSETCFSVSSKGEDGTETEAGGRPVEEELFEDAEAEWTLERMDPSTNSELPPLTCPFCETKTSSRKTRGVEPSMLCCTCGEYFCSACFTKVHATERMKLHTVERINTLRKDNDGSPLLQDMKAASAQRSAKQPFLFRMLAQTVSICFSPQMVQEGNSEKSTHADVSLSGDQTGPKSLPFPTNHSALDAEGTNGDGNLPKRKLFLGSSKVHVLSSGCKARENVSTSQCQEVTVEGVCC